MVNTIFLHIPKAGGMTLRQLIAGNYSDSELFFIDSFDYPGSFRKLRKTIEKDPTQLKLVGGHIRYGLHRLLPGETRYITIMREPVDRIVSQYHYISRTPQHYLYKEITANNASLMDYVNSGLSREVSNDQTRMISGAGPELGINDNNYEYLALAKNNLEKHFSVVGLLERFNESIACLSLEMGWSNLIAENQNITSYDDLPPATNEEMDIIRTNNLLDIELYSYAENLFDEKVKSQGQAFENQLQLINASAIQ